MNLSTRLGATGNLKSHLTPYQWSVDVGFGANLPLSPFSKGFGADNGIPHLHVGSQVTLSPILGLRSTVCFDQYSNSGESTSFAYSTAQYSFQFEGFINTHPLFQQPENNQFNLVVHGGFQVSLFRIHEGKNEGKSERNGGILLGFTPSYHIARNVALYCDWSYVYNIKQDFTWDGGVSVDNNRLGSKMVLSVGFLVFFEKAFDQ